MDFTLAFVADKNILDTICISKLDLDSNCIFIIIVYLPSGEAATTEKKKDTKCLFSYEINVFARVPLQADEILN